MSQIKELFEHWTAAVRNEDVEGILAHHSDDIVMFDVPPPFQSKGINEYRRTWETFFSWSVRPIVFEFSDLEIQASDTVAYCHAIGHCSGVDSSNLKEKLTFRLTMGLCKIGDQWKITHEHHSLPNEAP